MVHELNHTERLFSYGSLQYESVQLATFQRKLNGIPDRLRGYRLLQLNIKDPDVVEKSGLATHPIIKYTGNSDDIVQGYTFTISVDELTLADHYEVSDYKRIQVTLDSDLEAWVYIGQN